MPPLPPLASIEAFLEIARLGSVKAAAAEMNLSESALSRRVQTLESRIGTPLFNRHHQALSLTEAGRALMDRVAPIMKELRHALSQANTSSSDMRLRINVLALFAQQRLFPRLPELRKLHPNLHLDVDTAPHGETRLGDAVDAAITLAREIDPALMAVRLDRDFVYPICNRDLAFGPQRIASPEQLQRATILIHREMPETFNAWRTAIGMPYLEPGAVDMFDSGPLLLEAAAQGLGIAFMHGHHLNDARDDRLVRLFDFDVESPYSYWFVCRPRALQQPAVKAFHDWVVSAKL